jgi:hypothetical protein
LDSEGVYFFVHIDKKSNMSEFQKNLPSNPKVVFLKDPIKVYRFDFSQVEATLKLLKTAFEFKVGFHSYCLLSGSDFPVKNNSVIKKVLGGNTQFIRIDVKVGPQCISLGARKWVYPINLFFSLLQRILYVLPRRQYKKMPLFQGSQWWALTQECVEFILDFLDKNKYYYQFMKYTKVPDEMFFHSLVRASLFRDQIYQDFSNLSDKAAVSEISEHGCHYIDWNAEGVILPKVLDLSDLDRLKASNALFARKIRYPVSLDLVDQLEKMRKSDL